MISADSKPKSKRPIEENIDRVAELHNKNEENISPHQRTMEAVTYSLGRPRSLYIMVGLIALWVGFNSAAIYFNFSIIDAPPFPILISMVNVTALLMATIILITQSRQERVNVKREHLMLQMALLVDQRTAKIIGLLEDIRKDSPHLPERMDGEAMALRETADLGEIWSSIKDKIDP